MLDNTDNLEVKCESCGAEAYSDAVKATLSDITAATKRLAKSCGDAHPFGKLLQANEALYLARAASTTFAEEVLVVAPPTESDFVEHLGNVIIELLAAVRSHHGASEASYDAWEASR